MKANEAIRIGRIGVLEAVEAASSGSSSWTATTVEIPRPEWLFHDQSYQHHEADLGGHVNRTVPDPCNTCQAN